MKLVMTNEYRSYKVAITPEILVNYYPYNLAWSAITSISDDKPKDLIFSVYPPGIYTALETLTAREQMILEYRFKYKLTLDETASKIGVTRERIRQIQAKALRKMASPYRSKAWLHDLKNRYITAEKELSEYRLKCVSLEDKLKRLGYKEPSDPKLSDDISISELDLSVRSYNCLTRKGIKSVSDLTALTSDDLISFRNLGRKSLNEILSKLKKCGFKLKDEE